MITDQRPEDVARSIAREALGRDALAPRLGNGELREPVVRDHVLHRIEAARVQLGGCRFERVDFLPGEAVAARLVPVRAVDRVVREADLLAVGLPVGARRHVVDDHDAEDPCDPNPPRETLRLPELLLLLRLAIFHQITPYGKYAVGGSSTFIAEKIEIYVNGNQFTLTPGMPARDIESAMTFSGGRIALYPFDQVPTASVLAWAA